MENSTESASLSYNSIGLVEYAHLKVIDLTSVSKMSLTVSADRKEIDRKKRRSQFVCCISTSFDIYLVF